MSGFKGKDYSSPYPDIHTSNYLKGASPTYNPSYLSGVDLAIKRANQKALTEAQKNYTSVKLNHNALSAKGITEEEKEKLQKIDDLAKFRPSKSREVATKVMANFDDMAKGYRYDKEELEKLSKKKMIKYYKQDEVEFSKPYYSDDSKFFSYFYPNRESLEERYKKQKLEKYQELSFRSSNKLLPKSQFDDDDK
jgi:hypothetical protein